MQKIDLRKFRFWYINHLIKNEARPCIVNDQPHYRKMTRKEANQQYIYHKKIGALEGMFDVFEIHCNRKLNGLSGLSFQGHRIKTGVNVPIN